jgi:hypothetical protein
LAVIYGGEVRHRSTGPRTELAGVAGDDFSPAVQALPDERRPLVQQLNGHGAAAHPRGDPGYGAKPREGIENHIPRLGVRVDDGRSQ